VVRPPRQIEGCAGSKAVLVADHEGDHRGGLVDRNETPARHLAEHIGHLIGGKLFEDPRFCGRRGEGIDGNFVARQFLAQRFRQGKDTCLGRRISGSVGVSLLARDGTDIGDAAEVTRNHARHDRAATMEHAGQVDVDHLLPRRKVVAGDRSGGTGDACVVHQNVDLAEGGLRRGSGLFDVIPFRLVAGQRQETVTCRQRGGGPLHFRCINVPDRHAGPAGQKALRDGQADPLCAAGDDGNPVREVISYFFGHSVAPALPYFLLPARAPRTRRSTIRV
jgi:hypothetical protein